MSSTKQERAVWRKARQKWLEDPKNRERDREAAKARYHARKKRLKKFEQTQLPLQ